MIVELILDLLGFEFSLRPKNRPKHLKSYKMNKDNLKVYVNKSYTGDIF